MNHATRRMRYLAQKLILHETSGDISPRTEIQAVVAVIEKLRPQLVELMGNTGYCALVSRSLAIAKGEVPWLRGARMNQDGSLHGIAETPLPGGASMLACLFGLLSSFVGQIVTTQLVMEVWPELSVVRFSSKKLP